MDSAQEERPPLDSTSKNNDHLLALKQLRILDTPQEQVYDDLVALGADVCQAPIAVICLADQSRLWFKAKVGLEAKELPRDQAFCSSTLKSDSLFVVEDAHNDSRFDKSPLVKGSPFVRFY
ncbi:MAG: hypothetical protein K2X47_17510, partial [Bdellovibrionales bacterium]|nr:hypothetical protein [Bdellovibrionales bacterium]